MSKINNLKLTIDGEHRFLNDEERQALLELLKNTKEVKYSTVRNKLFKGRQVFLMMMSITSRSPKR